MLFATSLQRWVFLYMVYGGIVLGFFYDVLRILRRTLHTGPWLNAVFDLIFWVVGAAFVFGVHLWACHGEVRYYTLLGLAAGAAFYMLGMSRLIMAGYEAVRAAIKKAAAYLAATKVGAFLKR
ncbi:MAG: spore cortex biosynthesis protein YabQ [Eubacteriales bacterium]|nr:spore cortex biosynthesis protein YabQ [Eubacteriales bacterium]